MNPLRRDVRVPGYSLTRLLGAGGMADVHEAVQLNLGRVVAAKIRRRRRDNHEQRLRDRFIQSARLHAKLSHPSIVNVIDLVSTDEVDALILECLRGPSLEQRLRNEGPIPVPTLIRLTQQIVLALRYLHEANVVHRDIKPSNIMHVSSHLDSAIRIMDFGVARDPMNPGELTIKGAQVGTLWYMSPEQLAGKESGSSCDLFALAVSLYELATGHLPLSSREQSAVFRRHLDHEPIPAWPKEIYESYPEFCDLVEACLGVALETRLVSVGVFGSLMNGLAQRYLPEAPTAKGPFVEEHVLERNLISLPNDRRARLKCLLAFRGNEQTTLTVSTSMIQDSESVSSLEDTVLTVPITGSNDSDGQF